MCIRDSYLSIEYTITFLAVFVDNLKNKESSSFLVFQNRLLSIQVSIFKTIGCRYELSLCFVLRLSFMFAFVIF